ncbi:Fe(3+) ABC transporter substrate-binding protein [Parahalioglobus pacificus]|nr:Fe(3+) ABC transporter substrate-binding protein [Halioglobus pacificus]NQY02756.1 Fe(3+) ABC transporter substrate-binding protein [Halieaceae bacterium]
MPTQLIRILGTALTALTGVICNAALAAEVNVYSSRQEALIKPLLDRFSEQTGTKINLVTGKGDALLTRLRSEGMNSPADILLTVDAGRLYRAEEAGVLQSVSSELLMSEVPGHLRDPDGQWYALSVRARAIVYAKDRVDPAELSTYEALTDSTWEGKVCIRSSGNIYNQSLIAGMIATEGEAAAESFATGLVANFARPPQGGDRDQIKAVAAGQCDVAIVNSYYLGGMINSGDAEQQAAAAKVGIFWPNQDGRGTHVNVSGAGVTKSAKNTANAVKLIEFLANDESQRWYAETNNEYPVRDGIPVSEVLAAWGTFKADEVPVSELGRLNADAVKVMDRAGWR